MQIAQVEGALGVRVFERDRRHVLVTPAGTDIVARARTLLRSMEELVDSATRLADPFLGTLRVVSKNTNELKTRLGCNKQVQMAKQPGGHKWPARWPPHGRFAPNDLEPAGGERASLADDLSDGEQVFLDSRQQALILNSTVLTVEPGETEPTAKLPAVSASRPMRPPWMTP